MQEFYEDVLMPKGSVVRFYASSEILQKPSHRALIDVSDNGITWLVFSIGGDGCWVTRGGAHLERRFGDVVLIVGYTYYPWYPIEEDGNNTLPGSLATLVRQIPVSMDDLEMYMTTFPEWPTKVFIEP